MRALIDKINYICSTATINTFSTFLLLKQEIKHSKPKEQESIINEQLNIGVFLQNVQKFVEDYEIEPKVLVNKEFKELQTKMQLLRTSYSTIEKVFIFFVFF